MKTLDQERSEFAWAKVQGMSKDYKNLAKSMPALVMTNGLMQALAFLEAKGENQHRNLLGHIQEWLRIQQILSDTSFEGTMKKFAHEMDSLDYQRATEETLAILRWIRHLADTL